MIPPVAPGQAEEKPNMVYWKNTFNMRQISLMNLAASQLGMKNGTKSFIPNLRRAYSITSPTKSLDILRKNLQDAVNKDIDNVIRKYIDKFFQPAINNIRTNLGKDSVGEDHVKEVCRQMLEEAKSMYKVSSISCDSSPYEYNQEFELELNSCEQQTKPERASPIIYNNSKRKESDTESESSQLIPVKRHRSKPHHGTDYSSCKLSLKRDGPKWNPDRVKGNTLFIMGARANKVLGYGQTRGRLYVRHPNLVRYSGDQEDKEWLASKNLMPPSGGKAYLMLLEDIKELTESEEYKHSPNLQMHELKGFEVPLFLLIKIKNFIEYVRNERKLLAHVDVDYEDQSPPSSSALDSAPSTPSDLDNHTDSPYKHDNFLLSTDMSGNLTNSVISNILMSNVNSSDSSQDY